ncbi:MAG TPA: DUF1080 domain-containing protein [Bryobacteraceae bacterium]|nr:DUF1080 domain-containing protein [Bryobacteraceae bacterium]
MLRCLSLGLLICSMAAAADHNRLTPEEKAAGWRLLFDGHSLAGWVDPSQFDPPGNGWSVEDGCIRARAHPAIFEDLFTRDTFDDFELTFEWRISPRGNSGVKYRIQDHVFLRDEPAKRFEDLVNRSLEHRPTGRPARGQDYVIGFEYQLIDNHGHPDALTGPLHTTGALYDMVPPSRDAERPVGEFNQSRLVVKGDHVEHWLNGVKVVDTSLRASQITEHLAKRWGAGSPVERLLGQQPRRACPISLQNHGDDAWFRDIKIRRTPGAR